MTSHPKYKPHQAKPSKRSAADILSIIRYVSVAAVMILFCSCGVLLDDAKFRGLWHLTDVTFYQYNEEYGSYLEIAGTDDLTPDTESPIMGCFFEAKMTDITMQINTNKTWIVSGKNVSGVSEAIISDSDSGKWEIDTYNNTVTLTCPKGADNTTDKLWSNQRTITNAWPMSTNNKFAFYVKASDFGRDYFEFELEEKPVPDRIEKQRLDDFLETTAGYAINSVSIEDFIKKWYILDDANEYYYLTNSISIDDKYTIYKILQPTSGGYTAFEYQLTTKRFYAMEGTFKRDGYQDK